MLAGMPPEPMVHALARLLVSAQLDLVVVLCAAKHHKSACWQPVSRATGKAKACLVVLPECKPEELGRPHLA